MNELRKAQFSFDAASFSDARHI